MGEGEENEEEEIVDYKEITAAIATLEQLRKKLERLSFENVNKYPPQDIRIYLAAQLNKVLIHNNLNLNYFCQTIIYKDKLEQILFTSTEYDHFELVKSYHSVQVLSLVSA